MLDKLKKHWYILSFISILLVAIVLRFYKLGEVPHGMTWDEAAIGYNGYAVLTTRRDEWLDRLPISFQSFGDYKAPLSIYVNGPFTALFGMNAFAVRLPFALFSITALIGIFVLSQEIFKNSPYKRYLSLFTLLLMSFSSWHVHYSRTGFESGIAVSFTIWGIYFLYKSMQNGFRNQLANLLSVTLFVLTIYTYHTSKIFIPLLLLLILALYYKDVFKGFKQLIFSGVFGILITIPFLFDALFAEGLTRANTTIFSQHLSIFELLKKIILQFFIHLSPSFLLLGKTTSIRHGMGSLGILYPTTFLLLICSLVMFVKANLTSEKRKTILFYIGWVVIGFVPAAIGAEVPHSNRALLAMPAVFILAAYGLEYLIEFLSKLPLNKRVLGSHQEENCIVKSVVGTLLAVHILCIVTFTSRYFTDFARISAEDFKDGYIEAFEIAKKYERGEGVSPVDKIIFTSDYGQPYIYALFVRKTNPIWYQGGSLILYEFNEKISITDLDRPNALIIGSNTDELPTQNADYLVYGSDGSLRFQIFKTK